MEVGTDTLMMTRDFGVGPDVVARRGEPGTHVAAPMGQRDGLVGGSSLFRDATDKIPLVADSRATVLITGETGTGKELFARAIHNRSSRGDGPFVPVNCAALPGDLIENELFGHVSGAYTGADATAKGLLGVADGGTLFLDEVNSLAPSAQSKLLRFLQTKEYRLLGSGTLHRVDVRVIAATNADLRRQVALHAFREDLYHRLYVLALALPPLRDRREDIGPLADHFLDTYARERGSDPVRFSDAARWRLSECDWPGNVRELQSVVLRSLLLAPRRPTLDVEHLQLDEPARTRPTSGSEPCTDDSDGAKVEFFRDAKSRVVANFERAYCAGVLERAAGNVTHAAKFAGMNRRDLQRLLKKHDISREMESA